MSSTQEDAEVCLALMNKNDPPLAGRGRRAGRLPDLAALRAAGFLIEVATGAAAVQPRKIARLPLPAGVKDTAQARATLAADGYLDQDPARPRRSMAEWAADAGCGLSFVQVMVVRRRRERERAGRPAFRLFHRDHKPVSQRAA